MASQGHANTASFKTRLSHSLSKCGHCTQRKRVRNVNFFWFYYYYYCVLLIWKLVWEILCERKYRFSQINWVKSDSHPNPRSTNKLFLPNYSCSFAVSLSVTSVSRDFIKVPEFSFVLGFSFAVSLILRQTHVPREKFYVLKDRDIVPGVWIV